MTAQHLSVDELAEAAEGLLDPERAALAESHLAGCPDCQAQSEALRESRFCWFTRNLLGQPRSPW
jgi:anti-sigma factor RsiW